MNKEEIIKTFEEYRKELISEYTFKVKNDQQGIGINIHKRQNNSINQVSVWVNKENIYTKFIPFINILPIEKVIQPVFIKHKYTNSYNENDHGTVFFMSVEPEEFVNTQPSGLPKTIDKESDVQEFYKILNEYIVNVAEPFFHKWGDIKFLNDYITTLPQKDISTIITDGAFKKAVIYKLCNNPVYSEYINRVYTSLVNKYEQNKDGDIFYKRNAEIIAELKEVLDNTAPIYY